MEKIRIQDIAEKAGVSSATVSNALNGRKGVSVQIARKVKEIADAMGYEQASAPGVTVRNYIRLVVAKKHGLVVMDTQFFAELIEGVEHECRSHNIDLMVTHLYVRNTSECKELINEICNEDCTGIMLLATELMDEDLRLFSKTRSALLVLDNVAPHDQVNIVVMNNYEAGYIAAQRLIDAGHKHIGHITSQPGFYNMMDREAGFRASLRDNGISLNEADVIGLTPTLEGAYIDMGKFMEAPHRELPTAFFAANDILAAGAIRAMKQNAIHIPDDVSIIGMDDLSICFITNPNISTIRVPRTQLGKTAVRRLLAITEEDPADCVEKVIIGVELVDRDSVRDLTSEKVNKR